MQVDIDELAGTFAYALFRQRWERKRSQLSFHDDQGWDEHIELVKSLKTQRVRQLAAGRFDDELLGAAQSILV